jgi:hypothetical protein
MKKLWILLILLTISFAFIPVTYSTFTAEENIVDSVDNWQVKYEAGSYYIESDFFLIEHDYLYLELGVTETETIEQEIIEPGQLSYVDFYLEPDIYDTPSATKYFTYEEEPWSSIMILSDWDFTLPIVNDPFNLGTYKGMYAKIKLQIKRDLSPFDRGQFIYILNSDDAGYILDWNFRAYNNIENPMTLLDLPETLGNPFESSSLYYPGVDYYGDVEFSYINGDVTFFITYQGYYVYTIPDVVLPSDDFLSNVSATYYYTVDTERFIYFAYDEDDDFLLTDTDLESKVWKGYSIWNLTTNEVSTTQRMWILTYIEVIDNVANAYTVIPDIPMDDLLSVSLTFTYRLGKYGLSTFFRQEYTDWQNSALVLQKGVEAIEEAYPQWVYDTWMYSGGAIVVAGILSAIPGVRLVTIPVLLAGGVALNVANAGALADLVTNNIDQIQKITYPSSTLVNTLNDHFSTETGVEVDVTGENIYKLAIGDFSGVDVNYVDFDTSNFKYTEIVWTTDGTIYSLSEDYIDNVVVVDEDYDASRPDESPEVNIMSMIMMPLITLFFIGLAWKTKAFSNPKQVFLLVALYVLVIFIVGK